eukprot:scaffold1973_cov399-Prasinococcus_capsulatus_cf.AAC.10
MKDTNMQKTVRIEYQRCRTPQLPHLVRYCDRSLSLAVRVCVFILTRSDNGFPGHTQTSKARSLPVSDPIKYEQALDCVAALGEKAIPDADPVLREHAIKLLTRLVGGFTDHVKVGAAVLKGVSPRSRDPSLMGLLPANASRRAYFKVERSG